MLLSSEDWLAQRTWHCSKASSGVLTTVKIKNLLNSVTVEYKLVAQSEADLSKGKISVDSPIGKGLLGKKVGEIAEISIPNGNIKFEILEISR